MRCCSYPASSSGTRAPHHPAAVGGSDQTLRLNLVHFDMALQPADLILQLSACPLESIVESKVDVRMPLVETWGASNIDLLPVRERHADVDLVETAGAVVFARCFHHHPAGGYAPEPILEAGNVLGNNCAQGLARLHSLEVDLDGLCMHPRPTDVPFRTLRMSGRTGKEHPPGDRAAAAFPADTRPCACCAGERLPRAGPPTRRACRRRDRAKPGPRDRPAHPRSAPR